MRNIFCMMAALLFAVGCTSSRPGPYVIPPPRNAPPKPLVLPPASLQLTQASGKATNGMVRPQSMPSARLSTPATVQTQLQTVAAKPAATPATIKPSAPLAMPVEIKSTRAASVYLIKPGDQVVVSLRGIPQEQQIEDQVDEIGKINLPFINEVTAAGKSSSELERVIRQAYIDQQIYKNIMVNVILPSQSYYVRGEVRQPGRFPLASGVTLVQALAAAGGYTEFANAKKIQLLRGNKAEYYDARSFEQHPEKDVAIEAGDVIVVHRSVF